MAVLWVLLSNVPEVKPVAGAGIGAGWPQGNQISLQITH